jgi:DNA-binding response OmpR family regulator
MVDDEPEIGRLVARVASGCGYEARVTHDPKAFKLIYAEFAPDVVALDLSMPDVDGIELLRFLADTGCQAPVLILSGFDARIREAAQLLGATRGLRMSGIIPKPVRVADLQAILHGLKRESSGHGTV